MLTGVEVEELVIRAKGGDAEAFSRLVRAHWRAAYCCALSIVRSPEEARDVVQDAMLSAFSGIEGCREPVRFSGWLLRIVRNRALNCQGRARLAREAQSRAAGDATHRDPDCLLRDQLLRAVTCLSEAQTQVLLLHDLEGWTHREISAVMEVSEVMSRQLLFEARRRLRARLAPDDGEDSHG